MQKLRPQTFCCLMKWASVRVCIYLRRACRLSGPHCYLLAIEIDLLTILKRELDSRKRESFLSWQSTYQPRFCQSKVQRAAAGLDKITTAATLPWKPTTSGTEANLNIKLLRLPDCLALPSTLRYLSMLLIGRAISLQEPLLSGVEVDMNRLREAASHCLAQQTRKSGATALKNRSEAIVLRSGIKLSSWAEIPFKETTRTWV